MLRPLWGEDPIGSALPDAKLTGYESITTRGGFTSLVWRRWVLHRWPCHRRQRTRAGAADLSGRLFHGRIPWLKKLRVGGSSCGQPWCARPPHSNPGVLARRPRTSRKVWTAVCNALFVDSRSAEHRSARVPNSIHRSSNAWRSTARLAYLGLTASSRIRPGRAYEPVLLVGREYSRM